MKRGVRKEKKTGNERETEEEENGRQGEGKKGKEAGREARQGR